ncbi:MAG: response regulator [Desulfobacterales bacterium]|nr:response regulator [Desulfobacterales bacterium]
MQPVIICVDDEETVLSTIKEQLFHLESNYGIELAESGEEALELVDELIQEGIEIPLVIADQIMPGIKGDELLRKIHARLPRTLKILLTGQASADEVGNAVNFAKLYRYIGKPWEETDLTLTVREAVRSYFRDKDLEEKNEELKKLNHSLRIRDERYNRAVEAGGVGVWDWNIETDEMYIAPNLKNLIGYNDHEIQNHMDDWTEHIHPDDAAQVKAASEAYLNGKTHRYEVEHRILHKDGSIRWFIVRGTAARDENGKPIRMSGTNTDITERKTLEENWRKYEFIANSAREFMTLINRDYVYTAANIAYCKAQMKNQADIVGKTAANIWGQENFEKLIKPHLDRGFEGIEVNYEAWFEFPGQGRRLYSVTYYPYINDKGEVTHVAVVSYDITERKQTEEQLRDSRQRLMAIFDSVQAGIIIIEAKKHIIVDANLAATEITGFDKKQLVGAKCYNFFCQTETERCPVTELNEIIENSEQALIRKNGTDIPIQKTVVRIMLDGQEHLLESFVDISRLKKAEEKKRTLEQQLRQSQKMQAIGTLAGGIAHDFNNILTPIMVNTEVTLLDIPEKTPVRCQLEEVLNAGRRARDLVKQILAFSRQSEQERKPLQIDLIVKEAINLIRASLPSTIEIRRNFKTNAMVLADPTQIHQVLMNLCTNAAHAMQEKGGTLEIGLADVYLDAEAVVHFPDLNPGYYLEMTVKDSGHGMDRSVTERIFDPYFTTKPRDEGTGLGLAVVQGIITGHGGAVCVDSEPGKGTTFKILIPEIEESLPAKSGIETQLPGGTEKILLVDDERATVYAVRLMLKRLGYEVVGKTNVMEGLEIFIQDPDSFDLVITDQTMPKMTGEEFAREVMRVKPDIPVILCTGYSELITEDKAKAMGIREFIMKPVVMSEIAVTIRRVIDD